MFGAFIAGVIVGAVAMMAAVLIIADRENRR